MDFPGGPAAGPRPGQVARLHSALTGLRPLVLTSSCFLPLIEYIDTGPPQPQDKDLDDMPQFGATFYPGGVDDFYMPEVVAPAPQR